ncbi:MAG: cbb3-type cytochrome c oxidase subunit 3 [Flavobacteriales bacterium]|nr:cbb3-type cytochrome c oxidase subunit 3 [Flavobacteriales bacterium]
MMKNIKYYLENETGMDFFGLFSLVIFFLFFSGLLIYVYRMNKAEIDELKNIPLKDDENLIS